MQRRRWSSGSGRSNPTPKQVTALPPKSFCRFAPVLSLFQKNDSAPVLFAAASGSKSMVKYEGGYTVETVFDGSKLGIEPYTVEVTEGGELLVMDSMNSNIYRMALPLSRCECAPSFLPPPRRYSPLNPACFGVILPRGAPLIIRCEVFGGLGGGLVGVMRTRFS
jgi:hypothetical protein